MCVLLESDPQPCFLWNWWDMSYETPISKSTKTKVIMSLREEENMVGFDWIAVCILAPHIT